jgi:transposase
MGRPYSLDLRERVIAAVEGGMSTRQAAARQGKPKGSVLDVHADFIFGLIDKAPDITLEEIAERLAQERAMEVVSTAVWKFLDRHDMTHKKRPLMRANRSVPM